MNEIVLERVDLVFDEPGEGDKIVAVCNIRPYWWLSALSAERPASTDTKECSAWWLCSLFGVRKLNGAIWLLLLVLGWVMVAVRFAVWAQLQIGDGFGLGGKIITLRLFFFLLFDLEHLGLVCFLATKTTLGFHMAFILA